MNDHVSTLSEEAAKLTPEERVDLVERINLTIFGLDEHREDAWDREAARRFEAYDRGEMGSSSWEEVKKRRPPE
jgi:putative addiction module component (TIGR02574 family)